MEMDDSNEKNTGLRLIRQGGIIAIIRGIRPEWLHPVTDALYAGGIRAMEITLNTDGAPRMIKDALREWGDRMWIGAGTVTGLKQAEAALEAGARYWVTPNVNKEVIRLGVKEGVPVFSGAMTSTEAVEAYEAGSPMVKIFPCGSLGPGYIKELQGPLSHIPMLAVGGITVENAAAFRKAGAAALGIGGSLVNLESAAAGDYEHIRKQAEAFVRAFNGG
jgi:2-dehydro-3-deoxyphosphogluconate aldolase / (4S)-4-hydroxy-2-oxoglutarate aldolase